MMDSRLIAAHLKRVQEEKSKHRASPAVTEKTFTAHTAHPDNLASHLLALTLTDDGPDPKSPANKLWNSRSEYQESGPSKDIVAGTLDPLPFADIAESLSRLCLTSRTSTLPSTALPASQIAGRRVSRKDGHACSVKALKLLSNIEDRANRCLRLLLDPSDDSIAEVTNDLQRLRLSWENIRGKADSVNARKREVATTLDKLELEVKARPSPSPSSGKLEPVNVDTGKYYRCQ
jgi:hypothetical protein